MSDLIEALQIFLKYGNPQWPTHCEHDELFIMCTTEVSADDADRLGVLGFHKADEGWKSFRFGSA